MTGNNKNKEEIPEIFKGAIDYKENPAALELAQATFNEEALYQAIASLALARWGKHGKAIKILDLCSATGLCALRVAQNIPTQAVTLVDIDQAVLSIGSKYFNNMCPVSTYCTDAATFQNGKLYDLILLNSAYHHIEDERKCAFLKNTSTLLEEGGDILLGEHFISPYRNSIEFKDSVVEFYSMLIKALEDNNEPIDAINVIKKAGLYAWQGEYEYKVSWNYFKEDCIRSKLNITNINLIWNALLSCEADCGYVGSVALKLTIRD